MPKATPGPTLRLSAKASVVSGVAGENVSVATRSPAVEAPGRQKRSLVPNPGRVPRAVGAMLKLVGRPGTLLTAGLPNTPRKGMNRSQSVPFGPIVGASVGRASAPAGHRVSASTRAIAINRRRVRVIPSSFQTKLPWRQRAQRCLRARIGVLPERGRHRLEARRDRRTVPGTQRRQNGGSARGPSAPRVMSTIMLGAGSPGATVIRGWYRGYRTGCCRRRIPALATRSG